MNSFKQVSLFEKMIGVIVVWTCVWIGMIFLGSTSSASDDAIVYYDHKDSPTIGIPWFTVFWHLFEQVACSPPYWNPTDIDKKGFLSCREVSSYVSSAGYPYENSSLKLIGSGYFREAYLLQHNNSIKEMMFNEELVFKVSKLKHGCNLRENTRFCSRNKFRHEQEEAMLMQHSLTNSPYIVHMLGKCGSTVISEYIPTRLEDVVARQHPQDEDKFAYPLSERRIIEIAHDVAFGIEVLHSASIVHSDIQLDQFLVRENGMVALNDLNRARIIQYPPWQKSLNHFDGCSFRVDFSAGKWRSPEEQKGSFLPYKIDIYSMGLIFWSLLSRQLPFARLSSAQAKHCILAGGRPPLSLSSCTSPFKNELCKLIRQCWDLNPTNRPEARVVRLRLEKLLDSTSSTFSE